MNECTMWIFCIVKLFIFIGCVALKYIGDMIHTVGSRASSSASPPLALAGAEPAFSAAFLAFSSFSAAALAAFSRLFCSLYHNKHTL